MHMQVKHLDTDDHAPEIAREEGNVLERSGREAIQDGDERVEEEEDQRVASEIATDLAVPGRGVETMTVEDCGLDAVDDHGPEAELADDFVQWAAGDEPFLVYIVKAVECGAKEREEVAFELIARGDVPAIGAGDVVGCQEQAHAADAHEDTEHLGPVIAHLEEGEGDNDHDDDGPEVDQLRREDCRVAVGEDGEVVAFDVEEGQDDVYQHCISFGICDFCE